MALHSLFPAYVQIDYHSPWGAHKMTLPTRTWDDTIVAGGHGAFLSWTEDPVDADDMIKDLVNVLKPFWMPESFFDQYTIYAFADEDSEPVPVTANSLGIEGTEPNDNWAKAVQTTFSIRTADFGQIKLVFLDAPQPASFDKILSFDASPEAIAVMDELSNDEKAWSGRDNARPMQLVQIAYTLNEKLRREYNMN